LISKFEAKKEEHLREERKVKNFEISDSKQKEMIKNKDMVIKLAEEKQRAMSEDNS
jgi:chromosome segregation ATPase